MRAIAPVAAISITVAAALLMFMLMSPGGASAAPTCSGTLDIETHGQHVVGDYVTDIGRADLGWPPSGTDIHSSIAGQGAAIPGGPGPGFHFEHGFAPGASFCLDQSRSPGDHLGP